MAEYTSLKQRESDLYNFLNGIFYNFAGRLFTLWNFGKFLI